MMQHTHATHDAPTPGQRDSLVQVIVDACDCKPHEREMVQQAVAENPALASRIHAFVELLYPRHKLATQLKLFLFPGPTGMALLGASEGVIRETFDRMLSTIFTDAAPRDLFDREGEVCNRKREIQILRNILTRRSEYRRHRWQCGDPLLPRVEREDHDFEERLARAVRSALTNGTIRDSEPLFFAAVGDIAAEVRCAAMEAAPRFVESYEVRQLLSTLDEDENDHVRRLAVEALAPLIGSWEVAERLFWYTDDSHPQIRLRTLTLLLENHWVGDHYEEIIRHAFSPYPEVAQTVRQHFSEEEIRRFKPDL
jgi:hypothetical protein